MFRAGYISARLLTKPGPAVCSLTAVTSGRSESPEGQPAEQVSGPASAQAVMLRDRFVNILNMNITQIIGVGNVTLGDFEDQNLLLAGRGPILPDTLQRSHFLSYQTTRKFF